MNWSSVPNSVSTLPSVAGDHRINLQRPAIDTAPKTLCLDRLLPEPACHVQAPHSVMAVNHDGGVLGYEFQALRNLPHGYQRGPFDPGDLIFPGLAAVDEKRLLILAVYHLGQRLRFNLHHIIHRRSAPLLR